MPACNLIIDSCCDLPADLVDQEGVRLLGFPYVLDGGTFEDDLFQSVTAHDFYEKMRKGAEPSTAQLPIPKLTEVFTEAVESGVPTVYLSFTSGLSGSYDAACLVRDQVLAEHPDAELYVVDTRLASVAEGLLIFEALRQHEKGMSASELAAWAEEARNFVNAEFMVEDLEALRRGGRIPSTVAVAGAALDVKPLLSIDSDGKLTFAGVSRGRKKGIKQLAEYYRKHVDTTGPRTVVIGHADAPKDAARLRDEIAGIDPEALIIVSDIGPVIGSHVGPGMLAVVFMGDDKRNDVSVAERIARRVKGGE